MHPMKIKLRRRDYLRLVGMVTLAHVVTYLAAGTLAYFFIYKSQTDVSGLGPLMRSPLEPEEWQHVETWLVPAQVLRGLLFGVALCPFLRTFSEWNLRTRFLSLLGILLVFSVWSVTMPAPGSIEGWVYLKPNYNSGLTLPNPLLGYLEVPSQLAVFAFFVSWRIGKLRARCMPKPLDQNDCDEQSVSL